MRIIYDTSNYGVITGKFPNGHVSGSKALRQKGIGCAQSQDREAQKKPRFSIDELEKALNDSMN